MIPTENEFVFNQMKMIDENINSNPKSSGMIYSNDNYQSENETNDNTFDFQKDNNFIIGTIKIKKGNLSQRIINSYENYIRENSFFYVFDRNEKEIKNCEIFINEEKIKFNYYYNFPNEGNYIIKYKFKNLLRFTSFMFYDCISLISLDLSNFKTQNVINMDNMFNNCESLISLDLSNINTQNVTNMEYMFRCCKSLKSLDLTNFNTQNVINMKYMFGFCSSLIT